MSKEEKLMKRLLPKQKEEEKQSVLSKEWYLRSWFEKLLYILGFFAILWKLFDIVILGRFP